MELVGLRQTDEKFALDAVCLSGDEA